MNLTGLVKLDKCKKIFTQDREVMNILATGRYGLIYGSTDSGVSKDTYYAIPLKGKHIKPVGDNFFLFEKYAEHIYDRDDLNEYEQEKIVNAIPGTKIPVTDFKKPVVRALYINAMSLMLDELCDVAVVYNKGSRTLSIVSVEE